jgi:hypothetical protein
MSAVKFLNEHREPINYQKIFNSFAKIKLSFKSYYIIVWALSVIFVYHYLKLDSIIAFVFLSLPILIITLFLPLALIDVWVKKQRKSKGTDKNKVKQIGPE